MKRPPDKTMVDVVTHIVFFYNIYIYIDKLLRYILMIYPDIPSGNLTQLWKITIFNGKIHYK